MKIKFQHILILYFTFLTGQNENVEAISMDHIKTFGVVSGFVSREGCMKRETVKLYSEPEMKNVIGEIKAGSIVQYDRLSILENISILSKNHPRGIRDREKFLIKTDSLTGWVDDYDLMTFTNPFRDDKVDRSISRSREHVVCLYGLGQGIKTTCSQMVIWELNREEYKYSPIIVLNNPINSHPRVENSKMGCDGKCSILLSAHGGDAEDRYEAYKLYILEDNNLSLLIEHNSNYETNQDFDRVNWKLKYDAFGNVKLEHVKEQYEVSFNGIYHKPELVKVYTTYTIISHCK